MIVGVGVDMVDVARFTAVLARTPAVRDRLFASAERSFSAAAADRLGVRRRHLSLSHEGGMAIAVVVAES